MGAEPAAESFSISSPNLPSQPAWFVEALTSLSRVSIRQLLYQQSPGAEAFITLDTQGVLQVQVDLMPALA